MGELPRLSLLGYQATRPRLRVLRLPSETVEPSPVPLNRPVAIDHGFAREGWFVLRPGREVWGIPASLDGKFALGEWLTCVPAANPRTVWLGDSTMALEYDGVLRCEVGRVSLPGGETYVVAAVPQGLVLSRSGKLWLGDEPLAVGDDVLATSGSRLVVAAHRSGQLTLVDASTGTITPVARPFAGRWNGRGSFSPDGAWFALGLAEQDFTTRAMLEPDWTRLALIEAETGAVTLAEGRIDNFATTPVWTADSRWLVFNAPFDKSLFACEIASMRLQPLLRRRGRPSPLADVTASDVA